MLGRMVVFLRDRGLWCRRGWRGWTGSLGGVRLFRGKGEIIFRGAGRWRHGVGEVWRSCDREQAKCQGLGRSSGSDVVSDAGGVIIGGRGMVGLGCAGRRSVGICGVEERFLGGVQTIFNREK